MIECELLKVNTKIVALSLVAMAVVGGFGVELAYAESSSANASVTVANTISLTLTGGDLVIDNLTPGNASDSNVITASVTSNSPYGFHLSATTGTSGGTTSLVNIADSNFTFTSLDSNKATLANFSDNTWGYSYSADGTNWISGDYGAGATAGYNGLPLDGNDDGDSGVVLFNSDSYLGSKSMQFKIGAKSATTQAAGTYTNTVNFYAVTNPKPVSFDDAYAGAGKTKHNGYYKMQDASASICSIIDTGQTGQLIDTRDDQVYNVAKLNDEKCWMVENLNIAGNTALSADDTNVTSTYINSFSTSNNLTKADDTIVLPASSTSGFNTNNYAYVYNSGNKTNCGASGQNNPCYSYYSWDAATLGSGRSISTNNTDAKQSICPKGWKLPTSRTSSAANWNTKSDFYVLAHQYGLDSTTSTSESDDGFYTQAGPGTIPNFLLAGYYFNGSLNNGGIYGYYWSSTSNANTSWAWRLFFDSGSVNTAPDYTNRYFGSNVRCLIAV